MPRATDTAIGVDVGGTQIRAGRIGRDGTLHARLIEPVQPERGAFAAQLLRMVAGLRRAGDIGLGIGIPGRVDGRTGEIRSVGYLDIAGLDLPGLVAAQTGLPCRVENDATMALVAEARARPDGAEGLIMMLTVGTGIGGAALMDGVPWYGNGFSGQFGHIAVAAEGPRCNCGRGGCIETFSSGTALGRLIAGAGLPEGTRAADLLAAAAAGDGVAADLVARWARPMQRAVDTLVAVADPRLVVLGGGLGAEMVQALRGLPRAGDWFDPPIEAAVLGDTAGIVGAGLQAFLGPRGAPPGAMA